ncbi:hypothetical protein FA15DRAFT_626277 [Coprinopsis marcescibilis]|uniref:UBC core domain-containing protein n=1 Tax=Coprinopsis marcescibilis TaxID=230819 RepID=A0A5C3KI66_COPMA|nr:hypothetical protein FA15DRAFT_626277 [Coprinopsis marcescibilis]
MGKLTRDRTSDSLSTSLKRQKLDHEQDSSSHNDNTKFHIASGLRTPTMEYDPNKNAHLKGRRRFNADLEDMKELCSGGYEVHGVLLKAIASGDDEGSFEVKISDKARIRVVSATFMVSDTSEYPKSHSFFAHSDDTDIPDRVQAFLEDVVDERPCVIKDLVDGLCASVAKCFATDGKGKTPAQAIDVDADTDDDDEGLDSEQEDMFEYDDDLDMGAVETEPTAVLYRLQENFVDIVASCYKPGLLRSGGGNDFIVSTSTPVLTLSKTIPPRALLAWDRKLLSKYQHLTLLISGFRGLYPVLTPDGVYTPEAAQLGVALTFKVGLSARYKPGKEQAFEAVRKHGLIVNDAEDELRILQEEKAAAALLEMDYWDEDAADPNPSGNVEPDKDLKAEVVEEDEDPGRFDRFSLSNSLESLMEQSFLKIVQLRRSFGLGWAGAEMVLHQSEKMQRPPDQVVGVMHEAVVAADRAESQLARSISLPHDPLQGLEKDANINLPLTAFSYLIRRLSLCTKYCIVCHNKLNTDFEALKPYVCENKLCSYQYYLMGRGPSLEYEIVHNPQTVDLLVSVAYVAAAEGNLDDPLPIGLDMRVQHPGQLGDTQYVAPKSRFVGGLSAPSVLAPAASASGSPNESAGAGETDSKEKGELVDFDTLTKQQMRAVIVKLIDKLPSIEEMKKHLMRKLRAGKGKPKLEECATGVPPAAWLVLRWIVGSCTAHIEEITSGDEMIKNLDPNWRQFRLSVGAPDAEAKFDEAVKNAVQEDENAKQCPVLYAFHGSPMRNWHSIIRHGLWFKEIAHGRAYGNGVYLAKEGNVSMGTYAQPSRTVWTKSQTSPTNCVALAELVNLPSKFVSSNPYFVVADTSWIMCRYLLLKGTSVDGPGDTRPVEGVRYVELDKRHKATLGNKEIQIPDPSHQVEQVLANRNMEAVDEDFDAEDMEVFAVGSSKGPTASTSASAPEVNGRCVSDAEGSEDDDGMDEDMYGFDDDYNYQPSSSKPKASASTAANVPTPVRRLKDDWKHDPAYVQAAVERLMLPPFESTPSASSAIQRELKSMLKEQASAKSLKELGWYMPEEFIGDNLYQWIVEMHSFDEDIPVAKDMKAKGVNSVIFEIRFPPGFPIAPPFFRVITPRFLPFIHGGGGHVTGGGSICMDLLTSDGWLPSYSIPAVLMQIKLAISNLDPRPARLASNYKILYEVREALEGFKRAAATHSWKLPEGLEKLVR